MSLSKEPRPDLRWWIANVTSAFKNIEEQCNHINYLEIKAVLFGLQSLCGTLTDKHIRI